MIEKINFVLTPEKKGHWQRKNLLTQEEIDSLLDKFPELKDCEKTLAGNHIYEGDYKSKSSIDLIEYIKGLGKEVCFLHEGYDRASNPFKIEGSRFLSEEEYEGASYFHVKSDVVYADLDHLEIRKRLELVFESTPSSKSASIGSITAEKQRLLCNQEMANLLENQNFAGLRLVKERLTGKYSESDPLFSIQSSVTCGNMLTPLVGINGKVLESLPKNGNVMMSDKYSPKLIRYPVEALNALNGCDIALTSESIGFVPDEQAEWSHLYKFQQLICSQRFRKWSIENKLPLTFVPVQFGDTLSTAEAVGDVPRQVSHEERTALSSGIRKKIAHDDTRIGELETIERSIYCLEQLSVQANFSGMDKFFGSSVGPLYIPIMEGLRLIGATEMMESLESAKTFFLGDIEPTEENILENELKINAKLDEHWEEAEAFFSSFAESDFHSKLRDFEDELIRG
jgi:hypothetical protein